MNAQPLPAEEIDWAPDPVMQARGAYKIEDLPWLPTDHRVELVKGRLVVSPSPTFDHQLVCRRLCDFLERQAPESLLALPGLGVGFSIKGSREPDVLLVDIDVNGSHYMLSPDEVTLAVEVVSPGTKRTDRFEKPLEYAKAGIPFYWRIETDPVVHIHAFRLVAGGYELYADSDTELVVTEPFEMSLPISELTRRR